MLEQLSESGSICGRKWTNNTSGQDTSSDKENRCSPLSQRLQNQTDVNVVTGFTVSSTFLKEVQHKYCEIWI